MTSNTEVAASSVSQDSQQFLEGLLEQNPKSRSVWERLAQLYREQNEHAKLIGLENRVLGLLTLASDRNALRIERVRLLCADSTTESAAIPLLRSMLVEEPFNQEALERLCELLTKAGDHAAVAYLLGRMIDAARERGDSDTLAALSLRLASLAPLPSEATAILRRALAVAPKNRGLLEALLDRLGPDAPAMKRLELLERLVEIASTSFDVEATLAHARSLLALAVTSGSSGASREVDNEIRARLRKTIDRLERTVADFATQRYPHRSALSLAVARLHRAIGNHSAELGWLVASYEADSSDDASATDLARLKQGEHSASH